MEGSEGKDLVCRCTYYVRVPASDAAELLRGSFKVYYPPPSSPSSKMTRDTTRANRGPSYTSSEIYTRPDGVQVERTVHHGGSLKMPPTAAKKAPRRPILQYVPPAPYRNYYDLKTAPRATFHLTLVPKKSGPPPHSEHHHLPPPPPPPPSHHPYYAHHHAARASPRAPPGYYGLSYSSHTPQQQKEQEEDNGKEKSKKGRKREKKSVKGTNNDSYNDLLPKKKKYKKRDKDAPKRVSVEMVLPCA